VHGGKPGELATSHGVPIVGGCAGHPVGPPPPAPLEELVVLALLLLEACVVEPPEPDVVLPVWLEVMVPPQRRSASAQPATKKEFLKRCMQSA
jgi:hypothetical protein